MNNMVLINNYYLISIHTIDILLLNIFKNLRHYFLTKILAKVLTETHFQKCKLKHMVL